MREHLAQPRRCVLPALVAMLAAGCLGSGAQATRAPHLPASTGSGGVGRWTVHRDRRDGLSVAAPPSWAFTLRPVPGLVEPSVPFAIGSGPVPRGGDCAPTRAIAAVRRPGVLIWVYEYHGGADASDFPARRRPLRLGALGGPFECLGVRAYTIRFRIGDREFQAHVVAHRPGPRLRSQAERVLTSLAVLHAGERTRTSTAGATGS
jgi:hypothetical protein